MEITQYSDNKKVIASGSFLLWDRTSNVKLNINFKPQYRGQFDLIFTFNDNVINEEGRVMVKLGEASVEKNATELVIENANNPFGTGTKTPTPILEFKDKKILYCNYLISRPTEENPRLFTYTLYIEG